MIIAILLFAGYAGILMMGIAHSGEVAHSKQMAKFIEEQTKKNMML